MNEVKTEDKDWIENKIEIKDERWQDNIRQVFQQIQFNYPFPNESTEAFYSVIWDMSINAFDSPREVQVIVDSKDDLYISVGTFGFVSFKDQEEQLGGMKLPIKCWIHTHPFGQAFFSGTDWNTIHTWKSVMLSATVLGDNQYIAYDTATEIAKKVNYAIYQKEGSKKPAWVEAAEKTLEGEE
jgi:hypothetical protein